MSTCHENDGQPASNDNVKQVQLYIEGLEMERAHLHKRLMERVTEKTKLRIEITTLELANAELTSTVARLRRSLRAKRAFELAIVCLMRRLPRDDSCRILAAKLIDRYGYHSSKRRKRELSNNEKIDRCTTYPPTTLGTEGSGARPADPFDLETEP